MVQLLLDSTGAGIGIPDGMAGWAVLKNAAPSSFSAFMNDPVLTQEIAYFKANAPKATTAADLLNNPRLADFALTAYGLTAQEGMTALMKQVLNSKPGDTKSVAVSMT